MDLASTFNFLTHASEFGCGFVLLGCFSRVFNFLGIVLLLGFCLKVLRFGWHSKDLMRFLCEFGGIPRIHLQVSKSKIAPLKCDPLKPSSQNPIPNPPGKEEKLKSKSKKKATVAKDKVKSKSEDRLDEKGDNEREIFEEDEMFDVMALRKLVKIERKRANTACAELEKERTAAASSAEEAMAMILRLQNEKSSSEIQANQFRRMAEQKLDYDQEVIESLRWVISQHESQKNLLEDQVGIYREKLREYMKEDEIDQLEGLDTSKGNSDFAVECDLDGSMPGSPETDTQNS